MAQTETFDPQALYALREGPETAKVATLSHIDTTVDTSKFFRRAGESGPRDGPRRVDPLLQLRAIWASILHSRTNTNGTRLCAAPTSPRPISVR